MPNWNTTDRGITREDEESYYESRDWDGKSCMDHHGIAGRGIEDIEDLTMLSSLPISESETE